VPVRSSLAHLMEKSRKNLQDPYNFLLNRQPSDILFLLMTRRMRYGLFVLSNRCATDLPLLIIPAGQVSSHKSINKDSDEETGPDNMRMDQVNSCNWSSIPARKEIGTT
jgi:hypothetical protein